MTKRLSNEHIAWMATSKESDVKAAAEEIQERRSYDLTPPQLDDLRAMLRDAVMGRPIMCGPERIEMLQEILRANGGGS